METDRAFAFPVVAHPAPAGDLLPLHQTGSCGDVAFQPRNGLLTPQCNGLHAGHIFPFLQVDPGNQTNYLFIPPPRPCWSNQYLLKEIVFDLQKNDCNICRRPVYVNSFYLVLGMASQLTGEISWMENLSC